MAEYDDYEVERLKEEARQRRQGEVLLAQEEFNRYTAASQQQGLLDASKELGLTPEEVLQAAGMDPATYGDDLRVATKEFFKSRATKAKGRDSRGRFTPGSGGPQRRPVDVREKSEKIQEFQKNRKGNDDDLDFLLDLVIPKGNLSSME